MHSHSRTSGNVLFLILIAVALFAALSYVVTQSSRSGSSSAGGEKAALMIAGLIQYPTYLRAEVTRMAMNSSNGADIEVDYIPGVDDPDDPSFANNKKHQIFHPEGGKARYELPSAEARDMAVVKLYSAIEPRAIGWVITTKIALPGVGGEDEPEVLAHLVGVRRDVCAKINEDFHIRYATSAGGAGPCNAGTYSAPLAEVAKPSGFFNSRLIPMQPGCGDVFDRQTVFCYAEGEDSGHELYRVVYTLLER